MEEEILKIIYNYYPKNIDSNVDHWLTTRQYKQLKNSIKLAEDNRGNWNSFMDCLKESFLNVHEVEDWTQFFNHDACYVCRLSYSSFDNECIDLVINVSVISNYYSIYYSMIKEKNGSYSLPTIDFDLKAIPKEFIKKIEELLLMFYSQYGKFPRELVEKTIPDISLGNKNFGDVTFFDCIFTTHVW